MTILSPVLEQIKAPVNLVKNPNNQELYLNGELIDINTNA